MNDVGSQDIYSHPGWMGMEQDSKHHSVRDVWLKQLDRTSEVVSAFLWLFAEKTQLSAVTIQPDLANGYPLL